MPANKINPVWTYFYQDTQKTVRCTLCDSSLKFCGNTTNMSAHLKSKHLIPLIDEGEAEKGQTDDLKAESPRSRSRSSSPDSPIVETKKKEREFKKRSNVWKFFTQEGRRLVRCNICNKGLKYCGSTTNMNSHLKCKHANDSPPDFSSIQRKDLKSFSDDADDEDDYGPSTSNSQKQNNNEDSQNTDNRKISKAEVKEILLESRNFLKQANERLKQNSELEIFGKYVATQLGKIGEEDQLQAQKAINQILNQYRLKEYTKENEENRT